MTEEPGAFALFCGLGRSLLIVYMAVQGGVVANPGTAIGIASAKTSLTFVQAFTRGILCNWLVCMAGKFTGRGKNLNFELAVALLCSLPLRRGRVRAMRSTARQVSHRTCSTDVINDRRQCESGMT